MATRAKRNANLFFNSVQQEGGVGVGASSVTMCQPQCGGRYVTAPAGSSPQSCNPSPRWHVPVLAFVPIAILMVLVATTALAVPVCDGPNPPPVCDPADPHEPSGPGQDPNPIHEWGVYRETSAKEMYVIQGGKKVYIPTTDALFAMGYNWSHVQLVPDGALQAFQRFDIPSSSQTPGSLVFPPLPGHYPLEGLPHATTIVSQGKQIQLAELRGWIRGFAPTNGCNGAEGDGADFEYGLEVDTDWALTKGIDLHKLLRIGNVVQIGHPLQGNPRAVVSIPLIKVELNSWGWRSRYPPGAKTPRDWTHRQAGCKPVDWPFDPNKPDRSTELTDGAYVKMSGSLVVDSAHAQYGIFDKPGAFLCRNLALEVSCKDWDLQWQGSVPDWAPNPESPDHPARWTEIHPPDSIIVLDKPEEQPKRIVTVRGLALIARAGIDSCEGQEFDIYPEAPRPTNGVVKYEELRSSYPEVHFPQGENQDNGSWIGVATDHIHVRAHVCGGFPPFIGSAGRFKALYRVWWEVGPPPQPDPGNSNPPGRACRRDQKCCDPLDDGTCGQCVPRNRRCD